MSADDLRWFCCPVCHHALELQDDGVLCTGCGRRYPVQDGIPVLLAARGMIEFA
ncbi:MAG: Trm112 family protein [Acidobacteriota bacterium]|nr:Trm112 family protein [Acidobacteriota bacterium]